MEKNSGGILIPLCSPCDAQDRFLPGEFEQAVRLSLREPADGLYVCGGTGEGLKMRLEERKEACEIAVSAASGSGRHVLVQIGAHTWRDALELAEHAARTGADAISSVPLPDASQAELAAYYRAVAAASGLDTIIYHTPQSSQTVEQVLECLEIPGVTGVKSSSNDFFSTIRLLAELPQGKILFNGKDESPVPAAVQGAHGGIGMWANVFPAAYADMYRLAKAGSFREAFALQTKLNELWRSPWAFCPASPVFSAARAAGTGCSAPRRPSPTKPSAAPFWSGPARSWRSCAHMEKEEEHEPDSPHRHARQPRHPGHHDLRLPRSL